PAIISTVTAAREVAAALPTTKIAAAAPALPAAARKATAGESAALLSEIIHAGRTVIASPVRRRRLLAFEPDCFLYVHLYVDQFGTDGGVPRDERARWICTACARKRLPLPCEELTQAKSGRTVVDDKVVVVILAGRDVVRQLGLKVHLRGHLERQRQT